MQFLFFGSDGVPLFVREDAESAHYVPDEYTLTAEFPFCPGKRIERGMRIGYTDEHGIFLPFEIRKCEILEPDHYQRITAEHIAVSELSDRHIYQREITDKTASAALAGVLNGTGWSVGTVTAIGTSSADISTGSVWQAVRAIEENWNVYITPRVGVGPAGITARALDIAPAGGTWNGVRLAIDKNADEVGVTYDDTDVITAMYGYGRSDGGIPLSFADVVWSKLSGDPANKPSGQTYVEDAEATALYGRNGSPRWGYYQNGNVGEGRALLNLTWRALSQTSAPKVSIDMAVTDLYRLGYADQPIRLHDTAEVDVSPIGVRLRLEIVKLDIDLLDPTATRVTIGEYIPNIVYINRQTAMRAGGGGGGGGGRGQSALEKEISEFETEIIANNYEISLRAYQRDMDNVEEILRQAGISINAQGVLVYADDNPNMLGSRFEVNAAAITSEVTRATAAEGALSSRITQNADSISLVVSNGSIKAAQIVAAINASGSSVVISADHIVLDGDTVADALRAKNVVLGTVMAGACNLGNTTIDGRLTVLPGNGFYWGGYSLNLQYIKPGTAIAGVDQIFTTSSSAVNLEHYHDITATESGGVVTITQGAVSSTAGTANFNIADTAYFRNAVAAARAEGAASVSVDDIAAARQTAMSYDASTKILSATWRLTAIHGGTTNLASYDKVLTVPGNLAYNAGASSVTIASDSSHLQWTTTSRSIGYISGTITAIASNGAIGSRTVTNIAAPKVTSISVNEQMRVAVLTYDQNAGQVTMSY